MDKNNRNNINPLRSRWRKAALAAALTAGLITAAPAMACFFGGVVFDPSNFVEHILEVSAALQRIARMESQLQNQERMLAGLGTNAWPGMAQSMQSVTLVLQNGGRFASADPAGQMATNEPLSFGDGTQNPDSGQMETLRATWDQDNRAGIFQNRQLENQVVTNISADSVQINQIVAASGHAPGLTAAIQAHNQLLANLSTQLGRIIALKAANDRLNTQLMGQDQSRLAYHTAVRQWVMHDWNNTPNCQPIQDPFGN
jgi:P-type conjugative transfer protein TrbJ